MYVLADCGNLKIAYLLLKSVWKAGQICSFQLQTVFKQGRRKKGKEEKKKKRTFSLPAGSDMSVYVAAA